MAILESTSRVADQAGVYSGIRSTTTPPWMGCEDQSQNLIRQYPVPRGTVKEMWVTWPRTQHIDSGQDSNPGY